MHLGLSTVSRVAAANRRIGVAIFTLILCATFSLAPCGGPLIADETPEITDFQCYLEGNWLIISGTVDSTGWVQITGATLFGFNVIAGEDFVRQIYWTTNMQGVVYAVLHTFFGLVSDQVSDSI